MEAHFFQHSYSGCQMCVFHCEDEFQARFKFANLVFDVNKWIYIGIKTVIS